MEFKLYLREIVFVTDVAALTIETIKLVLTRGYLLTLWKYQKKVRRLRKRTEKDVTLR